jgi:hypothetical protein
MQRANALDETLLHQAALPMAQCATSDHRFYDRFFVTITDPAGSALIGMSMGVYKNMNVVDGFGCLAFPDHQINVRVSRPLGDELVMAAHGLSYHVVRPWHELRLRLEGDHPLRYDLTWRSTMPPIEEAEWWGTRNHVKERLAIDVRRYEQVGRIDGWVEAEGNRIEVRDWFGVRDHSWGVRGTVGGFEPYNGGHLLSGKGMLLTWFMFDCGEFGGVIARTEDDSGQACGLDGWVVFPTATGKPPLRVVAAQTYPVFPDRSRYYTRAELDFSTSDGGEWHLSAEALPVALVCRGGGYEQGWGDQKGLGVHRGNRVEHDVYRHGERVHHSALSGGGEIEHNQREQIARVVVSGPLGRHEGMGDCTLIAKGILPAYGFGPDSLQF